MKIKKIIVRIVGLGLLFALFGINLNAQNRQNYKMDKTLCAHFVKLSKDMVSKDNLSLAKVYAQKVIQANPWEKSAWANYNDVIQKLTGNKKIKDFDASVVEPAESLAPKLAPGEQYEGC